MDVLRFSHFKKKFKILNSFKKIISMYLINKDKLVNNQNFYIENIKLSFL